MLIVEILNILDDNIILLVILNVIMDIFSFVGEKMDKILRSLENKWKFLSKI